MPIMFRFHRFEVYVKARELHKKVIAVMEKLPRRYSYLRDQTLRASLSVVLNIAEGAGKSSDREFNRFLMISVGSVYEVVACLDVSYDQKLMTKTQYEELVKLHEDIRNLLGGFSRKLKS